MITQAQAKLILSECEDLILNPMLLKPVSPSFICLPEEKLHQMQIAEQALDEHGFYDGKEHDHKGRAVHVFVKAGLEKYAGQTWQERMVDKKPLEIGG